jgi:hypothetical protein
MIYLFAVWLLVYDQDAQDLGLSIELLPLSRPDEDFNMSLFYAVSARTPLPSPPVSVLTAKQLPSGRIWLVWREMR